VDRRIRLLAAQHQARQLRLLADPLGDHLVDAGAAADLAAGRQRRTGEQVAGLRTVDVALQRLGVVQPADEDIRSRKSASGVQTLPSSIDAPSPLAHHSCLWKPLPANRIAIRVGGCSRDGPQCDHDELPGGPGERIVNIVIGGIVILLFVAIWADTPADAPADERFLSRLFLRIALTVIAGGFLYGRWRKRRRSVDDDREAKRP
jgi:hypothetical protein